MLDIEGLHWDPDLTRMYALHVRCRLAWSCTHCAGVANPGLREVLVLACSRRKGQSVVFDVARLRFWLHSDSRKTRVLTLLRTSCPTIRC